jgi:hypothetical protein
MIRMHWKRIQIAQGVDKKSLDAAKKAAAAHTKGSLHSLPFTEAEEEWVLLYEHAQIGQISPQAMKYMKRKDLYYLAGMTFPHPKLMQPKNESASAQSLYAWTCDDSDERWDRVTKLQGNAARAKHELERRNFVWASIFTILAAMIGGFVGSSIGT